MQNSVKARWKIIHTDDETGEVLYCEESPNVVVDGGRALTANCLFGLSASGVLVALGAGACSTAAAHTDTHLNYEHILNATRKTLTNSSSALLTSADIVTTSFSDGYGEPYYKKIVVMSVFTGASDNNVNQPFQEFGLFTTTTLPGTPTSSSGTLWNHYISASPVTLTSTTTLSVLITIYF